MAELVLALDLGTGGCKASIWDAGAACLAETTASYPTHHPAPGRNEQRPRDWWEAAVESTRALAAGHPHLATAVTGVAFSGHSLGAVMLDAHRRPIRETTPIWSDSRAVAEAEQYFGEVSEPDWYATTGNGFSPSLYPLFKAMWFRRHDPEAWGATIKLVGSKDYVNLLLTGELATDHSYASGSGCYDLVRRRFDSDLMASAGLGEDLWPDVLESTDVVGRLTATAAGTLGLPAGVPVYAGGVDNACMALGSRGTRPGRIYAALGSSSWITVTGEVPVLDQVARPYVFAHVIPGMFVSALSTFSTGTTMTWLRDLVAAGTPMADLITEGCGAQPGAGGLLFLPMLAGGTPLEGGARVRGSLRGLDLSHRRPDIVRAALEGIAASLGRSLDTLGTLVTCDPELTIAGGGSRHEGWNQVYADMLGRPLNRTSVDEQAAALGAAATAMVGSGAWRDFSQADAAHTPQGRYLPEAHQAHRLVRSRFDDAVAAEAEAVAT